MNQVLIVSEHDDIGETLKKILASDYELVQDCPDFILIAAKEEFSYFFGAKEKLQQNFPEVPMLFLWIEEDRVHILSCSNLQYMDGKTIPRSEECLLTYLNESFADMRENNHCEQQRLTDIQSEMRSNYPEQGALKVEYDNFASIFQFVEQLAKRSGQFVQMLLLSLVPSAAGRDENGDEFRLAKKLLTEAVQQTLRKNDVLTGCSDSQMLVLLMDADDDGGHFAANRIFNTFLGLYDGSAYELHYDVKPVGAK